MTKTTPMLEQYYSIKKDHEDSVLLFRLGDFYEAFHNDAEILSKTLDITLTGRGKGDNRIPMAGIPHHALDNYLPKLIKSGVKVAIAEQVTEAGQGKIVEREVVKIVTSGTYTDSKNLEDSKNHFIACIYSKNNENYLAYLDLSTGELCVEFLDSIDSLFNRLKMVDPAEILISDKFKGKDIGLEGFQIEYIYESDFDLSISFDLLNRHFGTKNLKGFGFQQEDFEIVPLGVVMRYAKENQKTDLGHICSIKKIHSTHTTNLDYSTIENLEILYPIRRDKHATSVFDILNNCKTSMGKRLLRKWIIEPLIDQSKIEERLNYVDFFFQDFNLTEEMNNLLGNISDIERIIGKLGTKNINGRDLLSLKNSLESIANIYNLIRKSNIFEYELNSINPEKYLELVELIKNSIDEECSVKFDNGGVIKTGYNPAIDNLRKFKKEGKNFIAEFQTREKESTSIQSLKVKFNKVFGYYIEVSKANIDKVPESYIRKQTLVNAERYITPELKEYEEKVLSAEEKLIDLEIEVFESILNKISESIKLLIEIANVVAHIDVYVNFARLSYERNYVKPIFGKEYKVVDSRHPVVEIHRKHEFISNNIEFKKGQELIILTGPNMSGKSTYIRQIALISLFAQIGCFVPAKSANLSVVDRIFTRVGASDNLSAGESTFMVEMTEAANILNNATDKSLIILDEIGRGTSTYDGVAIAWSIVEYIHEKIGAKTFFATHYHELINLEKAMKNVANFHVEVNDKNNNEIVFTHSIKKGATDRSYGIHVASMAGIPDSIIERADEILLKLESGEKKSKDIQMKLF